MNIRKTITSEIEWNTIKKAQADGKLQELLQVGDELDITLKAGGTRTGAGGRHSHDETAERLRAGDAAFSEGQGSVRGRECTASVVLRALFIHIAETGRAVRPVCRGQPPGTDDGRLNTYI